MLPRQYVAGERADAIPENGHGATTGESFWLIFLSMSS